MAESTTRHEDVPPAPQQELVCPVCQVPAGRLIRGKVYCGNCGFIES